MQIQGPTLSPVTCLAASILPPQALPPQSSTPLESPSPAEKGLASSALAIVVVGGMASGELRVWRIEVLPGPPREKDGGGGAEGRAVVSAVGVRQGAHSQAVTGVALSPLTQVVYSTSKVSGGKGVG